MAGESGMGKTVIVAIIALAVGVGGAYLYCRNQEPLPKQSGVRMIIGHEDSVAWMPVNNTFGDPHRSPEWSGLLFQLGSYDLQPSEQPGVLFQSIALEKDGKQVALHDRSAVRWVNIVTQDTTRGTPLNTGEENHFILAIGQQDSDCAPLNTQASTPALRECLRNRSIHRYFQPRSILTYWHGENGYEVSVGPPPYDENGNPYQEPQHATHNRYEFGFPEPVDISVYPLSGNAPAQYTAGTVDTIRINWGPPGPNHGRKQDPPW